MRVLCRIFENPQRLHFAGINPDRLALFPKSLQQLAARKRGGVDLDAPPPHAQPVSPHQDLVENRTPGSERQLRPQRDQLQEQADQSCLPPLSATDRAPSESLMAAPTPAAQGGDHSARKTDEGDAVVSRAVDAASPVSPLPNIGKDAASTGDRLGEAFGNEAQAVVANAEQISAVDEVQSRLAEAAQEQHKTLGSPRLEPALHEEQEQVVEGELRNPASPGCVYSGLQLELMPGGDQWAENHEVSSQVREDMEELKDIAQACEPEPEGLEQIAPQAAGQGTGDRPFGEVHDERLQEEGFQHQDWSPIQTLPPASQIDTSVLDALPLQMKREIERAYGKSSVASL